MKKIIFLFLLIISATAFSQKKFSYNDDRHFAAKYVLKGTSDTVSTRIMNVGVFKASVYSIHTWVNKMMFIDENGKKKVMKEGDLDFLQIVDNKGKIYNYYSSLKFFDKDLGLVEPLYISKMTWIIDYFYTNLYGNLGSLEYFIEKGKDTIDSGLFTNTRKKLKERFAAYPDLVARVESYKTREDLQSILADYDKK